VGIGRYDAPSHNVPKSGVEAKFGVVWQKIFAGNSSHISILPEFGASDKASAREYTAPFLELASRIPTGNIAIHRMTL
jgi:hypothetical protein